MQNYVCLVGQEKKYVVTKKIYFDKIIFLESQQVRVCRKPRPRALPRPNKDTYRVAK